LLIVTCAETAKAKRGRRVPDGNSVIHLRRTPKRGSGGMTLESEQNKGGRLC
jgi:hypothetical protein